MAHEDHRWVSLFFDQGDKASEILHAMLRFDGEVTYQGATEESIQKAYATLRRAVGPIEPTLPVYDGIAWGSSDQTIDIDDGYVIAYNTRFGYVSLSRKAES